MGKETPIYKIIIKLNVILKNKVNDYLIKIFISLISPYSYF